jgi:hypothetical protein
LFIYRLFRLQATEVALVIDGTRVGLPRADKRRRISVEFATKTGR